MDKLKDYTPKQREILIAYLRGAQKLKRHLSRSEMRDLGFSRDAIRASFSSLIKLKEEVKKVFPKEVEGLVDEQILNPEKSKQLRRDLKQFSRFVITTAVDGAPVHKGFLNSIKNYCKRNDAMLLVIPAENTLKEMDPVLVGEHWILEDTDLNSNFRICTIKISPKAVQPTTSLQRIGQREGSMIVASPKQFLEFVAVGTDKYPHAVMSSGAITVPNYYSKNGEVRRVDYIANHDHVLGAVIVEVEDDSNYHFRQIQADESGHFFDLGLQYTEKTFKKVPPQGMLWGDLHAGEVDQTAKKASIEMMLHTGVRRIFWGDAFSGISINHHEEDNHIKRAILAGEGKMSLEDEIRELVKEIDEITSHDQVDELVIVASNHHDFLSKHYLPKGKYVLEPQNYKIAHKLVSAMLDGKDPLQYACETLIGLAFPEKVKWLKRDEDIQIGGVQMGAHGDKGANGSKGSKRTIENAYGRAMHGHTHSPHIFRGVFCVGTNSLLRPGFNEGPSGWVHNNGFVYDNGMCQLVNIFNGRWRLKGR